MAQLSLSVRLHAFLGTCGSFAISSSFFARSLPLAHPNPTPAITTRHSRLQTRAFRFLVIC